MDQRHALTLLTTSVIRTTRRTALRGLTAGGLAGLLGPLASKEARLLLPPRRMGHPVLCLPGVSPAMPWKPAGVR
jgi:hypothetical protein